MANHITSLFTHTDLNCGCSVVAKSSSARYQHWILWLSHHNFLISVSALLAYILLATLQLKSTNEEVEVL